MQRVNLKAGLNSFPLEVGIIFRTEHADPRYLETVPMNMGRGQPVVSSDCKGGSQTKNGPVLRDIDPANLNGFAENMS